MGFIKLTYIWEIFLDLILTVTCIPYLYEVYMYKFVYWVPYKPVCVMVEISSNCIMGSYRG
jgi:hypothetical protein